LRVVKRMITIGYRLDNYWSHYLSVNGARAENHQRKT
jgi:hypothetical protein